MSKQTATFNEVVKDYFKDLDFFTVAITRAHGKNHPEAFEVRELFEVINEKVKEADTAKPNLEAEFTQLRKITDNYTIPEGVCGTFVSVYNMLSEVDKSYHT